MNKSSLFVAIPAYSSVSVPTIGTIIGLTSSKNIEVTLSVIPNSALLTQARAELLSIFINNKKYTHMLMLDSDMSVDANLITKMLQTELDVVTTCYLSRHSKQPLINLVDDKEPPIQTINGSKVIRVESTGLGCVIISRKVANDLTMVYPELKYMTSNNQEAWDIFSTTLEPDKNGTVRFYGEDVSFFRRISYCDIPIHCMVDATISHAGLEFNLNNFLQKE
jgi:hypothetical protein